jgi:hypothetical protein
MVIASFYSAPIRYILGSVVLVIAAAALISKMYSDLQLRSAQREFHEIERTHGHSARDHCPHRLFTLSQKDLGVIAITDKWCKVCGKHLGPATLRKSVFGNKWV